MGRRRDAARRLGDTLRAKRLDARPPDDRPAALSDVPPVDRGTFVEHFEEIVTDATLRRDDLLAHLEAIADDELCRGASG